VRWTPFSGDSSFAIAIENPSSDIDTGQLRELDPDLGAGLQGSTPVPDLTGQYNRQTDWGHYQIAGILRDVAFDSAGTPNNEPKGSELGWGLNATTTIETGDRGKVLLGVVHGDGIASYMNDGGVDLAPDGTSLATAHAEAVPLTGVSAYYNLSWNDTLTSSFGYSLTTVDNTGLQAADAFHSGEYASANVICYPTKNVFVGVEGLWGRREDNDGSSGDDKRIQFSFHYSFSSKDIFKKN
jgi:hypothetical protein